jgi:hypothetical protein
MTGCITRTMSGRTRGYRNQGRQPVENGRDVRPARRSGGHLPLRHGIRPEPLLSAGRLSVEPRRSLGSRCDVPGTDILLLIRGKCALF